MQRNAFKNILIICDNKKVKVLFEKCIQEASFPKVQFTFASTCLDGQKKVNLGADWHTLSEKYDLIFSAHCKKIFPKNLLSKVICINLHPGYNPDNRGWYPQVFAIINNSKLGATLHVMDEHIDCGPIIDRESVVLESWDTSSSAYEKILQAEEVLLKRNFNNIINNTFLSYPLEEKGVLNSKEDFHKLCHIPLNELATFQQVINRLRALSHDNIFNAYFIDDKGNKVFLSLVTKVN